MKNEIPTASSTTTEKPFGAFSVDWPRAGTFVPVATISPTPDWVRRIADSHHGGHEILSGTPSNCLCMVFVHFGGGDDRFPPGDWLIYYRFNDDEGTHDHQLCVAARII